MAAEEVKLICHDVLGLAGRAPRSGRLTVAARCGFRLSHINNYPKGGAVPEARPNTARASGAVMIYLDMLQSLI